jgi:hypothetical protein
MLAGALIELLLSLDSLKLALPSYSGHPLGLQYIDALVPYLASSTLRHLLGRFWRDPLPSQVVVSRCGSEPFLPLVLGDKGLQIPFHESLGRVVLRLASL